MKTIQYSLSILITFLSLQKALAQTTALFNNADTVSHVFMPNVFTPNGDSINDVFFPLLDEITTMSFSIYNRYGNLIFETAKLRGFWDGYTTSGTPCTEGVYFCVLTATGIDGKQYKEKTFIQLFPGKR